MENEKKVELERRMLDYMYKTSKHLFVDESDNFIKVLPVKIKDKWMAFGIMFGKGDVYITKRSMEATSPNSLFLLKTSFFPQWETRRSIPNFKAMRIKMLEVINLIQRHYDDEAKMKSEIKNLLKDESFLQKDLTTD